MANTIKFASEDQRRRLKVLMSYPEASELLQLLQDEEARNTRQVIWGEDLDARDIARARVQCYQVLTKTLRNV